MEYRENLKEILDDAGYPNDTAGSVKEALKKLDAQQFDVILLDFMMPDIDGINAIEKFKKNQSKLQNHHDYSFCIH